MTLTQRATAPAERHRVGVLALDNVQPLEVGMPFHVFDWPELSYEVLLCGRVAGAVPTCNGWPIVAPHGLETLTTADTVFVPAFRADSDHVPDEVLGALRSAHRNGARIVSICTGAFVLAAAGLLDGRRATTHWRFTKELARRHPAVEVDPDVLYVDEGDVVTSAGVVSGIDLCLHLVRRDYGAATANAVAREIVAAPYRAGGQAQFVDQPARIPRTQGLGPTYEWAFAHLDEPLTVADFARHAGLSHRTFARTFAMDTGTTPIKWLNHARVDRARELLETTDASIDRIARACGLGSPANLRQHFRRITGTTPRDYRSSFAA